MGVNACFPLLRNQFKKNHKERKVGLCGESIRATTWIGGKAASLAAEL